MIGGAILAVLAVVGFVGMIAIAAALVSTANRSENRRRVRDYRRDPPGPGAREARQRQGEQIEFACAGMCIAARGANLTGAYYRTAEEEQAVRQACEWTPEDQARFNLDYNPIEIDLPAAAPIEVPNWPGVRVRHD